MKYKFLAAILFSGLFVVTACADKNVYLPVEKVPVGNTQEIHVDKAYDFVYLSVFDAVNTLSNWAPDKTLKDEGLVRLRNTRFERFDDSDLRVINVRIRRDNPNQTSVFLDSDSQRVIGADEVIKAIRTKLNAAAA